MRFLTVEPDGRDDVGFADRLRHALQSVFAAVHGPEDAKIATERALQAADQALEAAAADRTQGFFAQIRVVGLDVAYADDGADSSTAYASYRRLGIEIGVARAGTVRAADTTVVGLDGQSFDLTTRQIRTGLASGNYRRTETGDAELASAARKRLEAAQTGLARVKAIQDGLRAYRTGDAEPLKRVLTDGTEPSTGRFAAVFPGIGALTLN